MHLYLDPSLTKKQIKRINEINMDTVKAGLAEKKKVIEMVSGKKFENYKLQKLCNLEYLLNSETPSLHIKLIVPNKGRIKYIIRKLEDKVLS